MIWAEGSWLTREEMEGMGIVDVDLHDIPSLTDEHDGKRTTWWFAPAIGQRLKAKGRLGNRCLVCLQPVKSGKATYCSPACRDVAGSLSKMKRSALITLVEGEKEHLFHVHLSEGTTQIIKLCMDIWDMSPEAIMGLFIERGAALSAEVLEVLGGKIDRGED